MVLVGINAQGAAVDNLAIEADMKANILDRRGFAMAVAGTVKAAICLGFLAGTLVQISSALAQTAPVEGPPPVTIDTLFVAGAIPVDVTAGSVTEARDRGLTQGRIAGFRKVVARIVAREDMERVPQVTTVQIIDMVREFSIANERSSAVRYLANLTVRFNPVAVRRLLRGANIPFTETLSKPLVVVPLMRPDAAAPWQLWEDTNAWRAAWALVPRDLGLVGLTVPLGDAQDAATLNTAQASSKDLTALNALAARYDAAGAIVAMATGAGNTIEISLIEVRADLPSEDISFTQDIAAGQPPADVLAAAATHAAAAVQENWKRRNRVAFGGTTQITALVPVADLKEWLTVKHRLDDVPLIDRLELQAITRDRAQITLYYSGEQRQLELAMSQHDLTLAQQNGVWLIQALGAPSDGRVLGRPGVAEPEPASGLPSEPISDPASEPAPPPAL